MDELTNKRFESFDYISRYSRVPYYYNKKDNREIYGIGTNMLKDLPWVAHSVTQEDNLDSLALTYYNNPTYWWIIAYFNDMQDPFVKLIDEFVVIKIPNISSIAFDNER